ncbi:hypothetical protein LCGC14_0365880 [marine sediment metagenome]|uniref:Uncharacterized protein n=1 Tax=marine sediment metagenome TaxID=412755 RepID=A0A0F9VU03_9ZZZZ
METLKEIEKRHEKEKEQFTSDCPHTEVKVCDQTIGFRHREISLICDRCRLNLLGYTIDGDMSYMSYVRDCVKGHPSNRK